jgi:hypothetical protein
MLGALLAGLLGAGAGAQASQQWQPPSPPTTDMYGEPRDVALASIVSVGENAYQRVHVRTHGRLDPGRRDPYFELSDGASRALLILGHGLDRGDVTSLLGGRVEVRGIVRRLRPKEYLGPTGEDLDLIEDPALPVLPAPSIELPRISITVLWISSDEAPERAGHEPGSAAVLANPGGHAGRKVTLVGRFRGANLFEDLPESSRRRPDDWVLQAGDKALWVTGKPPRGKGFSLDPRDRGETTWQLEVSGRIEVAGDVVYLRASDVKLAGRVREAQR